MSMNVSESFQMGWTAISANKLRSFLTILGIVFGVGAVIAMLAIGEGAQKEIMDQLTLTGVNNIVIKNRPLVASAGQKEQVSFSKGLTMSDIDRIIQVIPNVKAIAPEVEMQYEAIHNLNLYQVKLVGTNEQYARMFNFILSKGRFLSVRHVETAAPVCVIGDDVRIKLFGTENPIDKQIKVGDVWLRVIGVVAPKSVGDENATENLGVRNYTMDVYIPATTFLLRFMNRDISEEENSGGGRGRGGNNRQTQSEDDDLSQLDKITVQMAETSFLKPARDLIDRLLFRTHYNTRDFEIIVPQELLDQQQKTKQIFNIVLGAIGGISLLVGGIGIMNIMLATVTERTKEIGIRRAIGATQSDIVFQFLIEALVLTIAGGIIGVLFGYSISFIIAWYAEINSIVTLFSIFISFTVACATGLIFGLYPARKAAQKDPVESLRYE